MKLALPRAIAILGLFVGLVSSSAPAEEVVVGGHFEISLFDMAAGQSRIAKKQDTTTTDYAGFQFLRFIPFIKCKVNEILSLDVRPSLEMSAGSVDAVSSATPSANTSSVDATTGATPVFGKAIGAQRAKSAQIKLAGFNKATVEAALPGGIELSVGVLQPRFTWDYGQQLFWEDEINGSIFSCNPWLGDFSDVGLEVVHYFDVGDVTIPAYAYILNGSGYEKVDPLPIGMIHIEPSFYPFTFHVSAGGGYWDYAQHATQMRFSAGASGSFGKFSFRTEGAYGLWERRVIGTYENAEPYGGYLKLFYRVNRWLRLSLGSSFVYQNFMGMFTPLPGKEQYITISPGAQILTSPSSRIIIQLDANQWIQEPKAIDDFYKVMQFGRATIGWRFTF